MSKGVKILIFIGIVALYVAIRVSFVPIELNNRAIILGVGIDFDEKNKNFVLSTEIITPKTSGTVSETDTQSNGQKIVRGEGVSVPLAVRDLYNCFGKTPSFGECCIILIGEDCVRQNSLKDVLDYFFASNAFRDGTVVAVCKGEAREMLMKKSQIDEYVSFALQTLLVDSDGKAQTSYTTLNDVAQSFFNSANSCYVNYIEFLPREGSEQDDSSSSSSGVTEQGRFFTGQAALFSDAKYVGKLDRQELDGLNLGTDENIFCTFTDVTRPDGYALGMTKKKGGMTVSMEDGKVFVSLKLTLTVCELLTDTTGEVVPLQAKQSDKLSDTQKKGAAKQAKSAIFAAYKKSVDCNCDVWKIKNTLYARYGKQAVETIQSRDFWQKVDFSVQVDCVG